MSRYIPFLLIIVAASFATRSAYSQEFPDERCVGYTVSVMCPEVPTNSAVTFTAHVPQARPEEKRQFKWIVSGGRIIRGQRTSEIQVRVFQSANQITATVDVSGLPEGCNHTASCTTQPARDARYPQEWWRWINDPKKPDWEILPQEANPGEVILSKRNELGLLSNFAATPFTFRGKRYASLEGFWQAMLYPEGPNDPRAKFAGLEWKYSRAQVRQMTAFEAKHAGDLAEENMRKMKIGWVSFEGKRFSYQPKKPGQHYRLIVAATWAKVNQNPEVKKALLSTGDLVLKPDHHQEPNAPAAWRYFEIWMRIRKELQNRAR